MDEEVNLIIETALHVCSSLVIQLPHIVDR